MEEEKKNLSIETFFVKTCFPPEYGRRQKRPKWTGIGRIARSCKAYENQDKKMWFRNSKILFDEP